MTRLVQLTDCHLCADSGQSFYNVNPYKALHRVLSQVAKDAPDGVLVTGDISGDDSAQSYQHFIASMKLFLPDCPWRVIPGNHDKNDAFYEAMGQTQLQAGVPWSLPKWHIHGLDTRLVAARGTVRENELASVAAAMAEHPQSAHLVALHHHIQPTHSWMDQHSLTNPDVLLAWLAQNHRVSLLIHGHVHAALAYTASQKTVLAAPSTCWQWALNNDFAVAPLAPGYRVIELADDGSWSSWIRRVE
ncbi:metallophosphoesterase [Alteromonas sp. C1M14]|uniref:metallophosphoesterase n=1 Tax=Alteromonas sp. C1M14 TaxID=2841567 RepID=UPI001C08DC27|nr:metallophosphoesterase [Alteromonas sp. C1M14]MBU2977558.1 metallophosphoesterase [Alteromonas sp. C1M14]